MPNPVIRSIIRSSNIDDTPERRHLHIKSKTKLKSRKTKSKKQKSKVRYASDDASYAGYSNLTDHPLPHIDHEEDLMEHIGHEYKMMH